MVNYSDAIKLNCTNRGKKRIQRMWNSAIFTLFGDRQHKRTSQHQHQSKNRLKRQRNNLKLALFHILWVLFFPRLVQFNLIASL